MKYFVIGIFLLISGLASASRQEPQDFTLVDHTGQDFRLSQMRGQVVLMFFGYTACPDVCPAELSIMSRVLSEFDRQGKPVKGLFISVDPERDSVEILRDYVQFFGAGLTGLTGSKAQIEAVTEQFRAAFSVHEINGKVQVDHSSNLYIIDSEGRIVTLVPFGMTSEHVINVVERLLQEYSSVLSSMVPGN